jgi:hypothetical protein
MRREKRSRTGWLLSQLIDMDDGDLVLDMSLVKSHVYKQVVLNGLTS